MKKRIWALMALCTAGTLFTGCQKEEAQTMSQKVNVDTEIAETGTLSLSSDYMGSVSASDSVNVTPLVSGTVEKVYVKVGDTVKKGDILCEFDDTSAQISVENAEISAETARAGKESAKTQQDLANAQTDSSISSLQAQLEAYEDSLKEAKSQLKKLKESQSALQQAASATGKTYQSAKTSYKAAQTLYVQYQSFLNATADCQTTSGLSVAMFETETVTAEDGTTTEEQTQKAKTATALQQALTENGLAVEQLSQAGLEALKENAEDAQTAYETAAASNAEAQSGQATLENSIETLEAQIKATKKSIASAKETASLSEEAAQDSVDSIDAQIEAAELGVEAAEYQASFYTLTAPMDGVVDTVNVKENEVFANAAAFSISGEDAVTVTYYVTEEVKDFIKAGDAVSVESNGETYEGSVATVATAVDQVKKLFKVEAQIPLESSQSIGTGTSVKLQMKTSESSGNVLIPYDSVYYDDNQAYIFTVEDGKAVRTDVETGLYNEDTIEITSGLQAGQEVITSWASGLKNGTQVNTGDEDE